MEKKKKFNLKIVKPNRDFTDAERLEIIETIQQAIKENEKRNSINKES